MKIDVAPKRRIAVLNRVFAPTGGGAERYSIALVEQLAQQYEIHVFAQDIHHSMPGVHYHRVSVLLRKPRWLNQLWYAAATWWATRTGFDIVHSHENTWHGQVQTVHVLPVKHTLFHGRTGWRRWLRWAKVLSSPRLLVYLLLERLRWMHLAQRRIVVSSATLAQTLQASYPQLSTHLSVILPGVYMPQTARTPQQQHTARLQLGLPTLGPCLLWMGNDYRKKGLATLLAVLPALPKEVIVAVVGQAGHIAEFRQQAQALGVEQRVYFLGALADVTPAYQAADALVHPTREDTFAMVVLEALAHALPVVVSGPQHCGISALLTSGQNALLLRDPRDPQELAQCLLRVLGDGALREQLSRAAVVFAREHQWPVVAQMQCKIYEELL